MEDDPTRPPATVDSSTLHRQSFSSLDIQLRVIEWEDVHFLWTMVGEE